MSPDWAAEGWEGAIRYASVLSFAEVQSAIGHVSALFPPEVVPHLRGIAHPVAEMQMRTTGRAELLEFGHSLSLDPIDEVERERVFHAEEFLSLLSERRAHLVLRACAASVRRPSAGEFGSNCDFVLTQFDESTLAVEVKLPRKGTDQRALENTEFDIYFQLARIFQFPSDLSGIATVTLASVLPADLPATLRVAQGRFDQKAWSAELDQLDLGQLGTLRFDPRETTGQRGVNLDMEGSPHDAQGEFRRMTRSPLKKALSQVRDTGLPGIVLVDTRLNTLASNTAPYLRKWARSARGVAAVLLLDSEFTGDGYYQHVTVFPGPEANAANSFLTSLLSSCASAAHYSTIGSCPCAGPDSA